MCGLLSLSQDSAVWKVYFFVFVLLVIVYILIVNDKLTPTTRCGEMAVDGAVFVRVSG